jgi:hypothetical protein
LDFQQALSDQRPNCFPDDCPADAKLAGKFTFRRETVAPLKVSIDDQFFNLVGDPIGQGGSPLNRLE